MAVDPYQIKAIGFARYEFISCGPRGAVRKIVEISSLKPTGLFNVAFGDVQLDGTVDDIAVTNNNDLIKVFATVIEVIGDFLIGNPSAILFFQGSSEQRTTVYRYILSRYYKDFSEKFIITAIVKVGETTQEISFDPCRGEGYLAFLVRRKL